MRLLHRVVGPVATNVYVLADEASRDEVRTAIYYSFQRHGVEIPWPIQVEYHREWKDPESAKQVEEEDADFDEDRLQLAIENCGIICEVLRSSGRPAPALGSVLM